MITVTSLKPRCSRDNELVVIGHLFLTGDHQLMLQGHCSKCLRDITILIPLAELYDNCPGPADFGDEDITALHELGISLPNPSLSLLP